MSNSYINDDYVKKLYDIISSQPINDNVIDTIFEDEFIVSLSFLLRHNLKLFIKIFFYVKTRKNFVFMNFHEEIIKSLQDTALGKAEKPYLMINIPPRFGKTEIASMFCAWGFAISPSSEFIYTSYSDDLVLNVSASIRDSVIKSPYFRKLFNVEIVSSQDSKKQWVTKQRGNFYAVAIGGAVTGMGAGSIEDKFDGALIIDDSIKLQEANSEIAREKVIDNFKSTLVNRLNNDDVSNKFTTPIIIIAQLTHINDFCMWFEETYGDITKVIRIGALKDGKSIWEAKKSTASLERMREDDPYNFYTQFMQTPIIKGGNIIKEEWIIEYDELPKDINETYLSCDLAIEAKKRNDYTVITAWGVLNEMIAGVNQKKYYLIDIFRDKVIFAKVKEKTLELRKKYTPRKILIEAKANGNALVDYLKNEVGISNIEPITPKLDKEARLDSCSDYFRESRVFFPKNHNQTIFVKEELTKFPHGAKNDDIVDSISQFLNYMSSKSDFLTDVAVVDI